MYYRSFRDTTICLAEYIRCFGNKYSKSFWGTQELQNLRLISLKKAKNPLVKLLLNCPTQGRRKQEGAALYFRWSGSARACKWLGKKQMGKMVFRTELLNLIFDFRLGL